MALSLGVMGGWMGGWLDGGWEVWFSLVMLSEPCVTHTKFNLQVYTNRIFNFKLNSSLFFQQNLFMTFSAKKNMRILCKILREIMRLFFQQKNTNQDL